MSRDNDNAVLEELTRVLVDRFAPERIVLVGSRGRGDHRPDSDYDLVIVMDEPLDPAQSVYAAVHDVHSAVDVIVDTPERFDRRRDDVGTIEYVADREGRLLYERESTTRRRHVREATPLPPDSLGEWIARAQSDFTMMSLGMASAPEARDAIVFHAHQGVEKMLKAALVAGQVPPPRTHQLMELLRLSTSALRDDPRLRDACRGLDALWSSARYPHQPMPKSEQVAQAIAWAGAIRRAVTAALG